MAQIHTILWKNFRILLEFLQHLYLGQGLSVKGANILIFFHIFIILTQVFKLSSKSHLGHQDWYSICRRSAKASFFKFHFLKDAMNWTCCTRNITSQPSTYSPEKCLCTEIWWQKGMTKETRQLWRAHAITFLTKISQIAAIFACKRSR